ncbi:YceD family protein [Pseudooceanicola nanhaiensis]|uniref:YceD family protein n=1 Tax=Pseudooceanicola nanhaiensis TaxID=375761 RepID=UPI0035155BAA
MADPAQKPLRIADLSTARPTAFELRPQPDTVEALRDELGLKDLRKVSFVGEVSPEGARGWRLSGHLGATVVQPCVVTLVPVSTRIEEPVERRYMPELRNSTDMPEEMEMPEDESVEPLSDRIDPFAVMTEALALALPLYPRASEAELEQANFAAPGTAPMTDEDVKPFAGLKALKDKLGGEG